MAIMTPVGNFGMGTVAQIIHELTRTRGGVSQHALLGEITFDLITYFEGMEANFSANYAEHALIEGKPRLQWVGDNLDEVSWSLVFHAGFCDPELEMLKLRGAITRHEALPLVFANGDYKGWFVPTDVRVTTRQVMRDGTLIWLEAELTLREYVRPVVLVEETSKQEPVATEKPDPNGQVKKPAQTVNRAPASGPPVRRQPGAHDDGHRLHRAHHPGGRTLGHVGLALLRRSAGLRPHHRCQPRARHQRHFAFGRGGAGAGTAADRVQPSIAG